MLQVLRGVAFWSNLVVDWVAPIYVVWSILAIASRFSTLLGTMASHGKTRRPIQQGGSQNQRQSKSVGVFESLAVQFQNLLLAPSSSWVWIPKHWFSHFYVVGLIAMWVVLTSTVLVKITAIESRDDNEKRNGPWFTIDILPPIQVWLTMLHLARRLYECQCVHQWNSDSKMHFAGYVLGMVHYLLLPLVVVVPIIHRESGFESQYEKKPETPRLTLVAIFIGIILNLLGQYEQYQHHVVLASLRRRRRRRQQRRTPTPHLQQLEKVESSTAQIGPDYQVTTIRGFQWIACPHYLAEIVIYLSLAILIQSTMSSRMGNPREVTVNPASIDGNGSCKLASLEWWLGQQEQQGWMSRFIIHWLQFLLDGAKVHRHWCLFGWVIINLSISACNTLEWNRRAVTTLSSSNSHSEVLLVKERSAMLDTIQKQKAIIPWIF